MKDEKNATKSDFESSIKYVFWAMGLGATSIIFLFTYANANFVHKDIAAERTKMRDDQISRIEGEIKSQGQKLEEHQKWLRDNWHKRNPQ